MEAKDFYRLGLYVAIGFVGVMAMMGVALLVPSVLLVELLFG
ncbi:hypothetical protein [Chelativorans xinjiangense]|nr:hypothetical protein [Chelativorans xinjiangense]